MPFWLPPGVDGEGITLTKDHAPAPPVGSVETIASELLSTAAQAESVGQETPFTGSPVPAVTARQPEAAAGLVDVIIWPALPVTHSFSDGQEMPFRPLIPPGRPTRLQADAGPAGLVEVTMFPSLSTAAQKEVVGQETPRKSNPSSSSISVQAVASPVGLVDETILPP